MKNDPASTQRDADRSPQIAACAGSFDLFRHRRVLHRILPFQCYRSDITLIDLVAIVKSAGRTVVSCLSLRGSSELALHYLLFYDVVPDYAQLRFAHPD